MHCIIRFVYIIISNFHHYDRTLNERSDENSSVNSPTSRAISGCAFCGLKTKSGLFAKHKFSKILKIRKLEKLGRKKFPKTKKRPTVRNQTLR